MSHETRVAKAKKFSKITQVQTRVEITFFSIFKEVETLGKNGGGKQSYLATSREDIREAHTILAYSFTDLPCSLHVYTSVHQ